MAITIKDVAREAGVSISTVSKVMNNWPTISEQTSARVRETMHRLDYTPNMRASSFARRSTQNIAFLTVLNKGSAFGNPHMFETMCGVSQALTRKGFMLSPIDVSAEEKPGETVQAIMNEKLFDGVIIHGSAISLEIANLLVRRDFPHIIIGKPDFESHLCWLDTNHVLAGDMATRHLIKTGCKRIAFIAGSRTGKLSRDRLQGFQSVMHEFGLAIPDDFIQYSGSDAEQSRAAAAALLSQSPAPDAIICESNLIAIGALKAIKNAGLVLPRDISLITFDDYPYSRIMDPMPTVVDIDVFDLGLQAGGMLLRKIKNPALQVQSYTTLPQLIQRGTTRSCLGNTAG